MKQKNRFYMYTEYIHFLEGMEPEDQALLFRVILQHEGGLEVEEMTPAVKAVFSMIKNRLDNNREEYEKTCEIRADSGRKGGLAKASKSKQKVAKVSKPKQNVADNENDNEKEKEKDIYTPQTPHADVAQVVEYMNSVCGSHYRANTAHTAKHIRARLNDGFTVEDCKRVVDIKFREWGDDEKMARYLRPETLFGGKFESYLNQREGEKLNGNGAPAGWGADYDKNGFWDG